MLTLGGDIAAVPSGLADATGRRPRVEVGERLRFESLIIDLAAGFISIDPERVDQAIEDSLRRIVEALGLDRSTLFQRSGEDLVVTHSWAVPGQDPFPKVWGRADLPWSYMQVMSGEKIVFSRLDDLPEEAAVDKALIQRLGPRSNATMPLVAGGEVLGALAFGSMRTERTWSPAVLDRLCTVAHMVCAVLARRHMDQQLRAALAEVQELRERLERENRFLRQQTRSAIGMPRIVGQSRAIQRTLSLVERVAPTDAVALIMGETGVGKELVAEAIHARSTRADRPIIKLNCAALPATLVEAELFGREKGAYTGALSRQVGRFELAHGSTLFLDEVCELPLELQAKLLRVLQEGEFERLGSPRTIRVDVRVIAATNRNLEQAMHAGTFRQDLFYRLNVVRIHLPPLRDRRDDIPALVNHFVRRFNRRLRRDVRGIAPEALAALTAYDFPGNIRELENLIERAFAMGAREQIGLNDLPSLTRGAVASVIPEEITPGTLPTLAAVEKDLILKALAMFRDDKEAVARALGLSRRTIYRRLKEYGIL